MGIDNWLKEDINKLDASNEVSKTKFSKFIIKLRTKFKDLSKDILEMPKWWYPIVFLGGWIWLILPCPWIALIFLYGSIKMVFYLDKKISKIAQITKEQIKQTLN